MGASEGCARSRLIYAVLHVVVTLPLVLGLIPPAPPSTKGTEVVQEEAVPLTSREYRAFRLMAGVLVLGGTVMTLVSVHLIILLQARGVVLATAVSCGTLIGPSQAAARIMEMANKGRHHTLWTLTSAMVLVALGVPSSRRVCRRSGLLSYSTGQATVSIRLRG